MAFKNTRQYKYKQDNKAENCGDNYYLVVIRVI